MTKKILITGATGLVGQALVPLLLQKGYQISVLSRRPQEVAGILGPEVEPLASLSALTQAPWGVVNLAGASIAQGRWSPQVKQAIRQSRIQGTKDLAQALARLPQAPQVLVSGSAVGFYGFLQDQICTEDSPPGSDFLAQVCQDWEVEAKAAAKLGTRVCLLRNGLVLDPFGGALAKMLPPFRWGLGGPLGQGGQWMSWIHLHDLCRLILFLLEQEGLEGPFNATAPEPVTNRDFARSLGQVLHRPAWLPLPGPLLRLGLGEMSCLLLEGQRVLPQRASAAGFLFETPQLGAALQRLLEQAP